MEDMFPGFCVQEEADGIELAEIQSENFHRWLSFGLGVEIL